MITIYKYTLARLNSQGVPLGDLGKVKIEMPMPLRPMKVGLDPQGNLCLWAMIDNETRPEPHFFFVCGTGWDIPIKAIDNGQIWIGTVNAGSYVWHVIALE